MPSSEHTLSCRGINGSIELSRDNMRVSGAGIELSQSADIPYEEVSAVLVQRKSVVPFATLTILAAVATLLARFNPLGYFMDVRQIQFLVTPIALGLGILFAAVTLVRSCFVSVSVRSTRGLFTVRFVPVRSGKRLAQSFSEISTGEVRTVG
jgi:hypothetical protein